MGPMNRKNKNFFLLYKIDPKGRDPPYVKVGMRGEYGVEDSNLLRLNNGLN